MRRLLAFSLCLATLLTAAGFAAPAARSASFTHSQKVFAPQAGMRIQASSGCHDNPEIYSIQHCPTCHDVESLELLKPAATPATPAAKKAVKKKQVKRKVAAKSPIASKPKPKVTVQRKKPMLTGEVKAHRRVATVGPTAHAVDPHAFVRKKIDAALAFLHCNQNECAARRLREALYIDPYNKTAHDLLDQAYRQAGADPSDPDEHLHRGVWMLGQGREIGAQVELEKALALKPSAENHLALARLHQQVGNQEDAEKLLAAAGSIEPANIFVQNELGFLHQKKGDITSASKAFAQSIAYNPNSPIAAQALIQMWEQEVNKNPNSPESILGLSRAYILAGNASKAQTILQNASMRTTPNGTALINPADIPRIIRDELAHKGTLMQAALSLKTSAQQTNLTDFMTEGPKPAAHPGILRNSSTNLVGGKECSSCMTY